MKKKHYLKLWILLICMGMCLVGCKKEEAAVSTYEEEVEPADEVEIFAVVSKMDEVNGKITLRAVNYATELTLSYNGGVDVKDKYGDILSMSQVELGSIVDAVYDANRDKLLSLYMSSDVNVQKLEQVSGVVVDNVAETVQVAGKTYPMNSNISAFSDNNEIEVNEICSEDQLTLWLYNDMVCSMYVELGHGYIKLSDYACYLGGMVEIGYDVIVPVTENMLLTVREGEYMLRIAKGDDVGTKKVKVIKNQEIEVSLADIAIEPKQMGSVLFKVTPSDATVYIDGVKVNTEGAVDIAYGSHKIYITAEGYESYSASFKVNYAYKIKEYTLKSENESSTEAQSASTTNTQNDTTQGTTTESTSSTENGTESTEEEGAATSNKVTVTTPAGASVYLDGEYIGVAPISFTKVTGSHILTFSKSGYLSKSYSVTFSNDGKDTELKYDDLISISSLIE